MAPVFKTGVPRLLERYRIRYLLVDTTYCARREVDLDGRVVSRGRFGSFDLLEVSSEAGDQLWTEVTATR